MTKQLCKKLEIKALYQRTRFFIFDKETKVLHNNIGPASFWFSGPNTYIDFVEHGFTESHNLKLFNNKDKIKPSYIWINNGFAFRAIWAHHVNKLKFPEVPIYNNSIASCSYNEFGVGKLTVSDPDLFLKTDYNPIGVNSLQSSLFDWLKEAEEFATKYLNFSLCLKYKDF